MRLLTWYSLVAICLLLLSYTRISYAEDVIQEHVRYNEETQEWEGNACLTYEGVFFVEDWKPLGSLCYIGAGQHIFGLGINEDGFVTEEILVGFILQPEAWVTEKKGDE